MGLCDLRTMSKPLSEVHSGHFWEIKDEYNDRSVVLLKFPLCRVAVLFFHIHQVFCHRRMPFLYILRFGLIEGLKPGAMISWQLFLAYMPGVIFVRTTPQPRIVETFTAVAPYRAAFVMATCLKFIPIVLTEIRKIYEGQVYRGAKILPRDLLNPCNWPDVVFCLVLPVIIRSMNLAEEITLAAKARNFGLKKRRTCWPGV